MPKPGDVVTVAFAGAKGVKRRPAVVVSSDLYHAQRPDLILGIVTTNLSAATTAMDCLIQDWSMAGLRGPSAFRAYLGMAMPSDSRVIGRLSDRDWKAVQDCMRRALA